MTDDERVRLAVRRGGHMVGPVESSPCADHPDRMEEWRWIWPITETIEHATGECVRGCDHPDHEPEPEA